MKPIGWKAFAVYVAVAVSGAASVATSPACPENSNSQLVERQGPLRSVQLTAAVPSQPVTVVVTTRTTVQDIVLSARLVKGTATAVHLSTNGKTPAETPSADAGAAAVTMPLCSGGCAANKFFIFVMADQVAADDPAVVEFSASTRVFPCSETNSYVDISYE